MNERATRAATAPQPGGRGAGASSHGCRAGRQRSSGSLRDMTADGLDAALRAIATRLLQRADVRDRGER